MNQNLTRSSVLLLIGALLGAGLVATLDASQEYRSATGYAFWSKADENVKYAYVVGYVDAEDLYRFALDRGAKPLCGDEGKAWIDDFDRKVLAPDSETVKQAIEGVDEFYKDWKNQGVQLRIAQNVVRMQIAGRPQAEIDEAVRKARAASHK